MSRPAGEKVRVQRKDHVRLRDFDDRVERLAEGRGGSRPDVVAVGRLPLVPPRLGQFHHQRAQLRGERGRADRLGQDAQSPSLPLLRLLQRVPHGGEKRRPRADLLQIRHRLGAVRIVEAVESGLGERVGRAETRRVKRVPLRLRGPPHVAFDQEAGRIAPERHRGREEERLARNDLFGLPDVRNDLLRRLPRARRQPRQGQRHAPELQEFSPVQPRFACGES